MKRFARNQVTFLLFGFVFWLPIVVLAVTVIFLFNNLEEIGKRILLVLVPEEAFHSGLGIAFGLLVVYSSGIVLKLTGIRQVFSKIPVIGLFFGAGEVVTVERLLHLTPCLFSLSPTCLSYGWILSVEKVKLGEEKAPFTLINVYYPNVPTLITGQVFPVRKDTVIRLGNPSKDIVDLLLYAFRSPADLKCLPWEDESREDFEKRAGSFGLNLDRA